MKLVLDVKNASALKQPREGQLIIYDGEKWYVTTRQELFKEYETKLDSKLEAMSNLLDELKNENQEFKNSVSKDIIKISDIVETMYISQGKGN